MVIDGNDGGANLVNIFINSILWRFSTMTLDYFVIIINTKIVHNNYTTDKAAD